MKNLIIIILLITVAAGCRPSTEITGSWKNENASASFADIQTVIVTALSGRTGARQQVENDLAAALETKGYRTIKSIDVLPPTFTNGETPDREELLSKINGTGADAILTVALIDEETESRYVPGGAGYAPMPRFGYYGTFWGYYNTWYPALHSPGYYEEDKVYFLETNLYDAKTEKLLWSAQSETYNPESLTDFASNFAETVVDQMERDGLLQRGSFNEMAREPDRKE